MSGYTNDARIPRVTWWTRLLCRVGRHRWTAAGSTTRVIPTGNALLISNREVHERCERCFARRSELYQREQSRVPSSERGKE